MLETEHFLLRPSTLEDVQAYLTFWNDPEVMQFIGDGTWGGGEEVIKKVLRENIAQYTAHPGLGFWSVEDKRTQKVVGEAGLAPITDTGEIEAGYLLAKPYWGKGLGTELLKGLLQYGFGILRLETIIAVAHPSNTASHRVMEKSGMQYQGLCVYHRGLKVKYSLDKKGTSDNT